MAPIPVPVRVSGARARSIPGFHVDVDRQTDVRTYMMEITTMWGSLRLAPIIVYSYKPTTHLDGVMTPAEGDQEDDSS